MDQAAEAMNQCSIHAKRAGNRFLMGLGMYNLAYAHYVRSNGDAALDCALKALADLEVVGAPRMVTAALTLVATVQMQRGELQDARATLERSVEDAVHGGLIWVDNRATLARLLLELEQPAEAIEQAMPMVQQAIALDLPAMHGDLLDLLARARQALGQIAEARASAHEALKLHLRLGRDDAAQETRELLDRLKT